MPSWSYGLWVPASRYDEAACLITESSLWDLVGCDHSLPPKLPSSSQLRALSPERAEFQGDRFTISKTRQVPADVPDKKLGVPEHYCRSALTVARSFDLSNVNQGHIYEIDAPPSAASVPTTPQDHDLSMANCTSDHSDHITSGDSLPSWATI